MPVISDIDSKFEPLTLTNSLFGVWLGRKSWRQVQTCMEDP
jgi:hypothetical protein